jgi:hypothetical protein
MLLQRHKRNELLRWWREAALAAAVLNLLALLVQKHTD